MQRTKCLHLASGGRGAKDYLKFTAQEDSTIALVKVGNPLDVSLVTSLNGAPWQPYTIGNTISLNEGDELRMRAATTNSTFSASASSYYNYVMTGKVAASGDLQSLIDSTLHNKNAGNMRSLFQDCASLTKPPYCSAIRYINDCFTSIFQNATGITRAMQMYVETCSNSTFNNMYNGCTALEDAGMMDCTDITTTTNYNASFRSAFYGCISLVVPPKITINDNVNRLYFTFENTFNGCISLADARNIQIAEALVGGGTFRNAFSGCTALTHTPTFGILSNYGAYGAEFEGAFQDCTSLVVAPAIDVDASFQNAFSGCTALEDASGVVLHNIYRFSNYRTFYGCTSLRIPPTIKCSDIYSNAYAFYECFRGCAALEYAEIEDFTGASWANQQFSYMFYGCTSLQRLKVHFELWGDGVNGTTNWLQNAAAAATFECPATLDRTQRDNSHILSGWTIETF